MKTTKDYCFSNGTDMQWWISANCDKCKKYAAYNERLHRMPKYRCAIQRDIEEQYMSVREEVSQRSFDACQQQTCPYFVDKHEKKDRPKVYSAKSFTDGVSLFDNGKVINIQAEAEKRLKEKKEAEAKAVEKEKLAKAMEEAEARRKARFAPILEAKPETPVIIDSKAMRKERRQSANAFKKSGRFLITYGSMIDVADNYMREAIWEMDKQKMLRFQLKKAVNESKKAHDKIARLLEIEIHDLLDFYIDALDDMTANAKGDTDKLYWAIKNVLDRNGIKNSALCATIQLVDCLNRLAYRVYGTMVKAASFEYGRVIQEIFGELSPIGLCEQWGKVCDITCPFPNSLGKDMYEDQSVALGVQIVLDRFTNDKTLRKVLSGTLDIHHEEVEAFYKLKDSKLA